MNDPQVTTIAGYLLHRLKEIGIRHLFGVPGDHVLGFLSQISKSGVTYIGTCNELNAAYAADGYARVRGAGAFASNFGVGELSALNGVAGAFAERVPVVVITGAPARAAYRLKPRPQHTPDDYDIPLRMFGAVTVAQACLDSAVSAPEEIDRVLAACLAARLPVYVRIPSDVAGLACPRPRPFRFPHPPTSDPVALARAVAEATARLGGARRPLVIAGVDLHRFGWDKELTAFLEKTGIPYVTRILGKGLLPERHSQFLGVYEGSQSREAVLARVTSADLIVQLGNWNSDTEGAATDPDRWIQADLTSVKIGRQVFQDVTLPDFLSALAVNGRAKARVFPKIQSASEFCLHRRTRPFSPNPGALITIARLFDRMSHFLQPGAVVLAETGVCLFSAAEMLLPDGALFIGQAFYGSIGYTLGATLGACLAAPRRQVVLFIGDGAFQVAGQELSTLIRHGLQPVIVLVNNDGYTFQRIVCDGPFNDLQPWDYARLPEVYGGRPGTVVRTEGSLELAMSAARSRGPLFLEVRTDRWDCPKTLRSGGRSAVRDNQREVVV